MQDLFKAFDKTRDLKDKPFKPRATRRTCCVLARRCCIAGDANGAIEALDRFLALKPDDDYTRNMRAGQSTG